VLRLQQRVAQEPRVRDHGDVFVHRHPLKLLSHHVRVIYLLCGGGAERGSGRQCQSALILSCHFLFPGARRVAARGGGASGDTGREEQGRDPRTGRETDIPEAQGRISFSIGPSPARGFLDAQSHGSLLQSALRIRRFPLADQVGAKPKAQNG